MEQKNRQPGPKLFAAAFILALLAILTLGAILHNYSLYDDAYITYRYARNLTEGHGLVWNVGERVEGFTSFSHVMLCAGALRLGLDPGRFAQALNVLAVALIAALGVVRLVKSDHPKAGLFAGAYGLYFATSPAMISWAFSGMETVLFVALTLLTVLSLEADLKRGRAPWRTSLFTLMAALTRPEGMALGLAVGICLLVLSEKRRFGNIAVYVLVTGLPFALYFWWRFHYFGFWFPNTYYAKVDHLSLPLVSRGGLYLLRCLVGFILPCLVFISLLRTARRWSSFDLGTKLCLIFFGVIVVQVVLTGGDYMAYGRFFLPALPLAVLALFGMVKRPEPTAQSATPAAVRGRTVLLVFVVVAALHFANPMFTLNHLRITRGVQLTRSWADQGRFLQRFTPPDTLLAGSGIGAIGYFSQRKLIDILGLTDVTIAHTERPTGEGLAGHEKYNHAYLLDRRPSVILVQNVLSDQPIYNAYFRKRKRFRTRAALSLLENPRFQSMYIFSELYFDDRHLTAFLRKDLLGKPGYRHWLPRRQPAAVAPGF